MICISGDTHGDFRRFSTKDFPQQKKMSRDDYLIITGDFGGVWNGSKEENTWLDRLEDKPFTTLFIDGNHENYTMLNALPVAEWNGGKVHQIRDHVLHLMRGQVFQLDDMTFFTMGGATSHDIEGGVLDPNAPDFQEQYFRAALSGKRFRILGESWWPEKLPIDEEYEEAMANLERVGWQVDCILTHCTPTGIALQLSRHNEADRLTDFLETVRQRCEFDYWFFGHYHKDMVIEDKYFLQYGQMTMIE